MASPDTTANLPDRLRSRSETVGSDSTSKLLSDAADEIEQLRATLAEIATATDVLESALRNMKRGMNDAPMNRRPSDMPGGAI